MELQVFNNEDLGSVRTVVIEQTPYFVGVEVARILGYSNASKAVVMHVETEDKQLVLLPSQNGNDTRAKQTTVINESGLYSLVLCSKLPTARAFKRWVTSEVLPSIRKNSYYFPEDKLKELVDKRAMELLADPDTLVRLALELKQAKLKLAALPAPVKTAPTPEAPVIEYISHKRRNINDTNISTIAKSLGIKSNMLFAFLREVGWLTNDNPKHQHYPVMTVVPKGAFYMENYGSTLAMRVTPYGVQCIKELLSSKNT